MTDADELLELRELRPELSQLRHDLAVERRHSLLLVNEITDLKNQIAMLRLQIRNAPAREH